MTDQTPKQNPFERANARLRHMTNKARWWTAIGVGALLILVSLMCTVPGLLLATFATDACAALPTWLGGLMFAPIGLAIGSILLAALLFGLRQRFQWVTTVLFGGLLLSICSFVAWFPLIAFQC